MEKINLYISQRSVLYLLIFSHVFPYILNPDVGTKLPYGGVGAISGGGATSKLLRNYPLKQRTEILDFLFKKNFGASLQILKVEIGGDSQSTDGVESSHMHTCDDESYERGYEWWLMKQAKLRNPEITLYALPWVFPGWLAESAPCEVQSARPPPTTPLVDATPYANRSALVDYTVRWVAAAKVYHGLDIDYLGIWNERLYDVQYIFMLRERLDTLGLMGTRLVAPDSADWGPILSDLKKYANLSSAIDIIGVHYPAASSPAEALLQGLDLWASEDYSKYRDLSAPGCWARIFNEGFVHGHLTGFIAWNMVTSYYDGFPYSRSSLMLANQPWSGYYSVDDTVWITAHITQFTEVGWTYLDHGSGAGMLTGNGTYLTLTNGEHYTIILQSMDSRDAKCFYPMPDFFVASEQDVTFILKGKMSVISKFYVWRSVLNFTGPSVVMQDIDPILVLNCSFTLRLRRNEIYTLTTDADRGRKGSVGDAPPPSAYFKIPYSDNFNDYPLEAEPYLFSAQSGVFEVRIKGIMSQTLDRPPIDTCRPLPMTHPIALIGRQWVNINYTMDVYLPLTTPYGHGLLLAGRIPGGGCDLMKSSGLYALFSKHQITIYSDYLLKKVILDQVIEFKLNRWYTVHFNLVNDLLTIIVGKQNIVLRLDPDSNIDKGFIGVGTSAFHSAHFDNFAIY